VLCPSNGGGPCVNPNPITGACPTPEGYDCVDLSFDVANCGGCGQSCGALGVCFQGQCAPCGGLGQLCCQGGEVCQGPATCNEGICSSGNPGPGNACGNCFVVSPSSFNFGQNGQNPITSAWCPSLPTTLTLTNGCPNPATLGSITSSNPSFVITGAPPPQFIIAAGGAPMTLQVTFEPTAAGAQSGAVDVLLVDCPDTYSTNLTATAAAGDPTNTDTFTSTGQTTFGLAELPEGQITVTANGIALCQCGQPPCGTQTAAAPACGASAIWTYVAATNSIVFAAAQPPGAVISISYPTACV
jgi:hypothetical protein